MRILSVNENKVKTGIDFNGDHFETQTNNEPNNNGKTISILFLLTFDLQIKRTIRFSSAILMVSNIARKENDAMFG